MANLSIGIVGLPNVGKSTLFNALLQKTVAHAANYPFATIEPNVGVVEVPDERLPKLAQIVETDTIVPAIVEFYDIAGLVKGASEGEGLGNQFLSHIREVAAIVHVVRLFEDDNILHVDSKVDPVSDVRTIDTELILADLKTLEKQKEPKGKASKEELLRYEAVQKLIKAMNAGELAKNVAMNEDESELVRDLQLLTMKPQIYVFNVSEEQLTNLSETKSHIEEILRTLQTTNNSPPSYVSLNAKLEHELTQLDKEEQKEYLRSFGLEDTGLNRLTQACYSLLGLISFLTAGKKEVRAWTIKKGMNAQKAAGAIHTDFEKHFIKADVVPYSTFVEEGGWINAREKGLVQLAGKDYIMKDGDVVEFKIGQ